MQEKLVIVPKKTTGGHKAGMIAFFVLTCLCLVLSMFVSPVMFLVPTIIFGVIWDLRRSGIKQRERKLPILVWMMC